MSAKIIPIGVKKKSLWQDVAGIPYLKLNTDSGVYYVRKFKAGKGRLFKSTGQTKKGVALTSADQMISDWIGGKIKAVGRRKTISEIIDELQLHLAAEFENKVRRAFTRKCDKSELKATRKYFGEQFADEIDEEFWEDWVKFTGRKLRRKTLKNYSKYLSKVLTFAYRRKYIQRKPVIKDPDSKGKTGRIYTDDEITDIVAMADPTTLSQIILGYESGLRVFEVRCLRKDWVVFKAPDAALLTLPEDFVKANARTLQLSPGASKSVYDIIKADKSGNPYVYRSAYYETQGCQSSSAQHRRWHKAINRANEQRLKAGKDPIIGKTAIRYLRHSFYNKALLELGLPIQQVSAYGGTSIQTLQKRYLLNDPNQTIGISKAISIGGKVVGSTSKDDSSD